MQQAVWPLRTSSDHAWTAPNPPARSQTRSTTILLACKRTSQASRSESRKYLLSDQRKENKRKKSSCPKLLWRTNPLHIAGEFPSVQAVDSIGAYTWEHLLYNEGHSCRARGPACGRIDEVLKLAFPGVGLHRISDNTVLVTKKRSGTRSPRPLFRMYHINEQISKLGGTTCIAFHVEMKAE
jgi:hypothetical protein